jgi:PPP family 3-phenylpropionic acid transporter
VIYWRLSGFYLFYFAALGALIPYWPAYLQSLGFSPAAIGELMATLMATRVIAPYLWGWIADHKGRRMLIVRFATAASLVSFFGVFLGQGFWWMALVMSVFSFFWNAALPQFEATTLAHLGRDTHRYSHIRLWGSVGFIFTVIGVGWLLETRPVAWLLPVLAVLFGGLWLSSLVVPEQAAGHLPQAHSPLSKILRQPQVIALFVVSFLMQLSHGPYYTFYTLFLEQHGYARIVIGQLWALGVIAEVGLFIVMHGLLRRFGLRALMLASLALAALRWWLIGQFVDLAAILIGAQLLHAASFAIHHGVAIHFIHRYFPGKLQGRGQALYSVLGFGFGGAVGALGSGYIWDSLGGSASYSLAAAICLAGVWVCWRWLEKS